MNQANESTDADKHAWTQYQTPFTGELSAPHASHNWKAAGPI